MPQEADRPPPPVVVAAVPPLPPPEPPPPPRLPQPLLLLPALPPLPPLVLPLVPAFPVAFLFDSPGGGPRDLPIGAPHSSLVTTVGGGASPHVAFEPPNFPRGLDSK